MTNIFFCGCPHFSSRKVLPFRNFDSPKSQDEHFLQQINKYVAKQDRLYILGDYDMSDNFEKAKKVREKINCGDVRLTPGNHCKLSMTAYRKIFQQVEHILEYKFGSDPSERIILSHYPFAAWNHSFRNSIMGYSHLHAKCEPYFDYYFPERRSLDLGFDNAIRLLGEYRPFSLDEILEILKDRRGNSPDRLSCRVTSCEKRTFQYPDDNNCYPGQFYHRYITITDYNWSDWDDNFNHGGREKRLMTEVDGEIDDTLYYQTFEKDGYFGFVGGEEIPVGSILFWGDDFY